MGTLKLYLIARISENAHSWNEEVCSHLRPPIEVFMPHCHNPWNIEHSRIPNKVFEMDLTAMKESQAALALPEFGSDCSFEVGWFSNSNRPVVVYIDTQVEWLRNWMVKGGVDVVTTTNETTYNILKDDPILRYKKVIYLKDMYELTDTLVQCVAGVSLRAG